MYVYPEMLGLCSHVVCWPFEQYLECGTNICSMTYVRYVNRTLVTWLVPLISDVAYLCACMPHM